MSARIPPRVDRHRCECGRSSHSRPCQHAVLDSTEALASSTIPKRLLVIGGSAVGVELAEAFSRLGSRVTLLARSRLFSRHDPAIGDTLPAVFRDEGIAVVTDTQFRSVAARGEQVEIATNYGEFLADTL